MKDDFLFVEKYAPKTIDECILPQALKDFFITARENKEVPNLILSGPPGIGKTSTIKALANDLGMDFMMINGSEEGRFIDTIRNKVQNYASTVSLTNTGKKILLIDEADNVTNDAQLALRGAVEKLQRNCIFIFTCNYKNKILPPLHSRCSVLDFTIPTKERPKIAAQFFERIGGILNKENIEYDKKVLVGLIQKHFPDFRRTLNELQRFTSTGKLEINSITSHVNINVTELLSYIKDRNFVEVRKWVALNIDNDISKIFRQIYEELQKVLVPSSIPSAVISIADYQYKSAFVMDQEINLLACLIEIMADCEFK
jgi:DNA polymerase III delta prime subunit